MISRGLQGTNLSFIISLPVSDEIGLSMTLQLLYPHYSSLHVRSLHHQLYFLCCIMVGLEGYILCQPRVMGQNVQVIRFPSIELGYKIHVTINYICFLHRNKTGHICLVNWYGLFWIYNFFQAPTLQYICNSTRYTMFMVEFIHNIWWLNMFRTPMVHPQERLQAVCCEFGMWYFAYYSIRPGVMRL